MESKLPRGVRFVAVASFALAGAAAASCDSVSTIGGITGGGGSGGAAGGGGAAPLRKVDKVDIVLGIDNSASMADKQEVMSLALADMITGLTSPPCVDATGRAIGPSNHGACPGGAHPKYAAIDDIHVGVVTSSLGGHGSDSCHAGDPANPNNNDAGHLVSRGVPDTYEHLGFVAWDPKGLDNPPGDSDLATFTAKVKGLVVGAGQEGCGFESQLESWYRFLVDPEPYEKIKFHHATQTFVPSGIDHELLKQRGAFLRPDSLLIIAMLSDENDCSTKEYGFFPLVNQLSAGEQPFFMPRARAICATDPGDPCCGSCGFDPPPGCDVDPTCADNGGVLDANTDPANLRCWDQKRRFGLDFSYPADRYIAALTNNEVADRNGVLVANPIFSYIEGQDHSAPLRDPGLVILTGIVGVPWQDIARDPNDLNHGYKSDVELTAMNSDGHSTWDDIVGDPTHYRRPFDPHMIEAETPRTGTDPLTGTNLAPPNSSPGADPINGHEYNIARDYGDLEYACTFPLPTPRPNGDDCTGVNSPDKTDPVCDPSDPTTQIAAKAYPGIRQLAVLQGLGPQGVVASICPANQTDATAADYAYRPAMGAVLERIAGRLATEP